MAHASDYGCTVLLCLANPDGPKAASECESPIDRLYSDLNLGRSLPACETAEGVDGNSYVKQEYSYARYLDVFIDDKLYRRVYR